VAHAAPPAASTQALLLLFHLSVGSGTENDEANTAFHSGKPRQERFYRALYSILSNSAMVAHGKHTTMFFNLLYKAMKYDMEPNRVIAFAKRIMATTLHCNAPALAATVFLLNEIASHQDALRAYLEDIPSEHAARVVLHPTKREPRAALVEHNMQNEHSKHVDDGEAKRASSWELSLVAHHFHPSVAKFGATVGSISYSGDPLHDFNLAHFLDKLAYRNPKSVKRVVQRVKRGESVAERRSFPQGIIDSHMTAPVNDPSFLQRKDIDVQDEFFRKFFLERQRRDEMKGNSRDKDNDEEMDEDDAIDAAEEAVSADRNVSFIQRIAALSFPFLLFQFSPCFINSRFSIIV
jgi:ribosome biogenesis protein MAK21